MLYYIAIFILLIPLSILFPIKKIGKKHLKSLKGKNFIISCNHMSNMDPVMMDITFNKKHRFLAKKELYKNKFFAKCMRSLGAVEVDREHVDPASIREIFRLIKKNKRICIFPQGTRAKTIKVEEGSAKEGVALFSIRTNTPVVPMMFDRKFKIFHRTKLLIGEPIYPDMSKKKDPAYVSEFANFIIEKMNELIDTENAKIAEKKAKALEKLELKRQKRGAKQQ